MPESKPKQQFADPSAGPLLSVRFIVALLLMAVGIAWILFYYIGVRPDPTALDPRASPMGPAARASWATSRSGTT